MEEVNISQIMDERLGIPELNPIQEFLQLGAPYQSVVAVAGSILRDPASISDLDLIVYVDESGIGGDYVSTVTNLFAQRLRDRYRDQGLFVVTQLGGKILLSCSPGTGGIELDISVVSLSAATNPDLIGQGLFGTFNPLRPHFALAGSPIWENFQHRISAIPEDTLVNWTEAWYQTQISDARARYENDPNDPKAWTLLANAAVALDDRLLMHRILNQEMTFADAVAALPAHPDFRPRLQALRPH